MTFSPDVESILTEFNSKGYSVIFHDFQYNQLCSNILTEGTFREDRTGVGTISIFGGRMSFNLRAGFPLLTGKRLSFKNIAVELAWFLEGRTDVQWLKDRGVNIWNEWEKEDGTIGPGYGKQWRDFGGVDQFAEVVERIRTTPHDRRLIVTAWNPPQLHRMALPPCHAMFQFYVKGGQLSCQLYQRSADMFLGVPYNIASYALLVHIVANLTNLQVDKLIWVGGDCHIYTNHFDQIDEQLRRSYRISPTLEVAQCYTPNGLIGWTPECFTLMNYDPHPAIKGKVAV